MEDPYRPYNDEIKQRAWKSAVLGYELGYDVENLTRADWKTIRSRFEQYYNQSY